MALTPYFANEHGNHPKNNKVQLFGARNAVNNTVETDFERTYNQTRYDLRYLSGNLASLCPFPNFSGLYLTLQNF